ncbi:MAG: hypothetical protein IKT60_01825 [Clostridia bacterium]|nr:hypothetical protein [Clostridia bacterium]
MKFQIDHDLHIHSGLSLCSNDPQQNPEAILNYARSNGLRTVCIADHYWDESIPGASGWYAMQNTAHITAALPLPQAEGIDFLFGCETEWDRFNTLAIGREMMEKLDFIVVPLTHFHMKGYTLFDGQRESAQTLAKAWLDRLDIFLSRDLPFHKMGLAHLTTYGIDIDSWENYIAALNCIPQAELERVMRRAAKAGVGIELNACDMKCSDADLEAVLRIYRAAKTAGCKFYLGSDAHHPEEFGGVSAYFALAIDTLGLTEDDKLPIVRL